MENAVIQRVKDQAKNLRAWTDEMQVQMALGKAEARDILEEERKTLTKYFKTQKKEIDKMSSVGVENRRDFLTCVENLESSLYQETPQETVAYDSYKNAILANIYKLEEEIRDNYPTFGIELQDKLDRFKAKMDAFRVNLALHDKDNPEKVEKLRTEFSEKLVDIRSLLNDQETAQTKLDHFVEDISESYNYLKRAISDLAS